VERGKDKAVQKVDQTVDLKSDTPILMMQQLCKNYQLGTVELRVLREIDLTITSGEYVAQRFR